MFKYSYWNKDDAQYTYFSSREDAINSYKNNQYDFYGVDNAVKMVPLLGGFKDETFTYQDGSTLTHTVEDLFIQAEAALGEGI